MTLTVTTGPAPGDPAPAADPDLSTEVRDLLTGPAARNAWAALRAARDAGEEPDPRPLYRLLGARGLLAAGWPAEFGGRGASARDVAAVVNELIAAGVPDTLHTLSVQICGNFLLTRGSPAQRGAVLPALAAGTRFCTVLYSEPEVGSDLAALTTRAVPVDGGWRITGRKVYSVKTRFADLGLVAARTDDGANRYQGITLFLVPLDAPGVTVGALSSVADEDFADVRLDGVLVPTGAVVGPVGAAWPLITEALALERTGVDYVAKADTWLRGWCRTAGTPAPAGPPEPTGEALVDVGRLGTRIEAARALAYRCVEQIAAGRVDPVQAAITKLWCSETAREVAWWCTDAAGPAGIWRYPDGMVDGRLEAAYREAPGLTLSAGTSEMMLELVAGSGLPLPDAEPGADEEVLARQLRQAVRGVLGGSDPDHPVDGWWRELAELGVFAAGVPTARDGLGLGVLAGVLVSEEAGRHGYDAGLLDTMTALDALVAAAPTHPFQPAVPPALAGDWRAVLVDPAVPDRPVPYAGADALLVRTATGYALIPADLPGVRVHPRPTAAGTVHTVTLDPGTVTAADELYGHTTGDAIDGSTGDELDAAVTTAARLRRAGWLAGLAHNCLAHTVRRTRSRQQFGRAVADNQAVAFTLARLLTRYEAIRNLLSATAGALDESRRGTRDEPAPAQLADGLLAASIELARDATRTAVQLHGAYGMTLGSPVERPYRTLPVAVAAEPSTSALYTDAAQAWTRPVTW